MMTPPEGMFPPGISCVFSDRPPVAIDLPAVEAEAARNMRDKRLREFAHGRACAREALAGLGLPNCAIPVGTNRAPVWPDGIVGSISHSGTCAAAVAAQLSDYRGLGVDLEASEPLDEPLLALLCRPEELDRLGRSEPDRLLAKCLFSAKESLFKCIWPIVHRFVDFQEIEIGLDRETGSFSATPHSENLSRDLIEKVQGRYTQNPDLIITAAYI